MIKTIEAAAAQELSAQGLVQLVDGTWQMGGDRPVRGFLAGTTASIDTKALKSGPPADRVANAPSVFGASDVSGGKPVCVYDRAGFFSAPWVAWLLSSVGHSVSLVSGWGEEETFVGASKVKANNGSASTSLNADKDDVLAAIGTGTQIVDARSPGRYAGTEKESRANCRSGHVPGSINLHYRSVVEDGYYRDVEDIAEIAARAGIDTSKPIITTCGSGVTASLIAIALQRIGADAVRVYQGSWAEWGADETLPIEAGA